MIIIIKQQSDSLAKESGHFPCAYEPVISTRITNATNGKYSSYVFALLLACSRATWNLILVHKRSPLLFVGFVRPRHIQETKCASSDSLAAATAHECKASRVCLKHTYTHTHTREPLTASREYVRTPVNARQSHRCTMRAPSAHRRD